MRLRPSAALAGALLVWALAVAVCAFPSAVAALEQVDDVEAVRNVFIAYKQALLEGDGDTAVDLVDQATLDYWGELRRLALEGSETEVRERSFIERLLIVSVRHEVPLEELEVLDLGGLIRMAVEAGWIGQGSIVQLEMGEVTVDGDVATGQALTGAGATGVNPVEGLGYRFVREAGEWRFSFVSLVRGLDRVIADLTSQLGTDENDLIFMLVESFSGRAVLPEVWERPEGAARAVEESEPPDLEPPP